MSVNWNWNYKQGEITFKNVETKKRYKINIYCANCLGALIYEYKDPKTKKDMYSFYGFWNDTEHLKNILGLSKKYTDNMYLNADYGRIITKIKLNTYYDENLKIAKLFAKAKIKVILYYEEPKKQKLQNKM